MRQRRYKYELKVQDPYPAISIDRDLDLQPELLCKYYSLIERNVSAVISHRVFVSNPDLFNDLYDTLFHRIEVLPKQAAIYKRLIEMGDGVFDGYQFNNSHDYRVALRNTIFALWNARIGVISTTDNPLNDLMWSHYTDNEGFLIQFDYNKFPDNFSTPIPISYLEPKEFSQMHGDDLRENLFLNTLHKKIDWQYENEYRILVYPRKEKSFLTTGLFSNQMHSDYEKESRLQDYPVNSIRKLILGYDFLNL